MAEINEIEVMMSGDSRSSGSRRRSSVSIYCIRMYIEAIISLVAFVTVVVAVCSAVESNELHLLSTVHTYVQF